VRARAWQVLLLVALLGGRAAAHPLVALRPVPDAIAGPTDAHVAATFFNPAALGAMRGFHLFADGGARLHLGSIERDPVDGRAQPSASITYANPDAFAGIAWDLGTDSITVGVAIYTPATELSSFGQGSAVRYYNIWQRFGTLEETIAAAWQIERHIAVGAALNVAESWIDYDYARDSALGGGSALVNNANSLCGGPCGLENSKAQQEIRLRGFGYGIGFSVGVLVHPDERVWLGASYISVVHNAGSGNDVALFDDRKARVSQGAGQPPCCYGTNQVFLNIPEIVQAGARVQLTPTVDLEAAWRFIHYGARSTFDVNLQGGNLGQLGKAAGSTGIPPQFSLDRGLQNAYAVELSTRIRVAQPLRVMPSLTFESAAVAGDAVSAAALDGPKLDGAVTVEYKARLGPERRRALVLGAHAGGTAYFLGRAGSRFDPRAMVSCVDAQYRLEACAAADAGDALPAAAGRYTLFVVNVGASIGFDY
jgi:long-subunit fatty acid transport protein